MTLIADFFSKLRTSENVVRYMSKKSCFKGPLTGNMVNVFKHCYDLDNSTATIFTDHFEGNYVEKSLF